MDIFYIFLFYLSENSFIYVWLLSHSLSLNCPSSCCHQKIVFHLYALRTTLTNNTYFSWCQETTTMHSITFLVLLTTTFMNYPVIWTSIYIFVLNVSFVWVNLKSTFVTSLWSIRKSFVTRCSVISKHVHQALSCLLFVRYFKVHCTMYLKNYSISETRRVKEDLLEIRSGEYKEGNRDELLQRLLPLPYYSSICKNVIIVFLAITTLNYD